MYARTAFARHILFSIYLRLILSLVLNFVRLPMALSLEQAMWCPKKPRWRPLVYVVYLLRVVFWLRLRLILSFVFNLGRIAMALFLETVLR